MPQIMSHKFRIREEMVERALDVVQLSLVVAIPEICKRRAFSKGLLERCVGDRYREYNIISADMVDRMTSIFVAMSLDDVRLAMAMPEFLYEVLNYAVLDDEGALANALRWISSGMAMQ